MSFPQYLDLGCAGVSAACAVYVACRDAMWRKGGISKRMNDRLDQALRWFDSPEAKAVEARMNGLTARISAAEDRLQHVATREDVGRVDGRLGRLEGRLDHVADGIDRLEGYFLERGVGVRS